MEELVAELTHLARRSPEISQRSGVSVRVSVANTEVLEAAALKRAVRLGETAGRAADLRPRRGHRLDGRQGRAGDGRRRGARGAHRRAARSPRRSTRRSAAGSTSTTSTRSSTRSRRASSSRPATGCRRASTCAGCARSRARGGRPPAGRVDVDRRRREPAVVASAVEFLLEGLHLARRINKDRVAGAGPSTAADGTRDRRAGDDVLLAGPARPARARAAIEPRRPAVVARARLLALGRQPGAARPRRRRDPATSSPTTSWPRATSRRRSAG